MSENMGMTSLYSIAKSIQPFIREGGDGTPEGIYRIILSNPHLGFIKEMFSVQNIPILVFVAHEISKKNDDPKIVGYIANNLFYFDTIEFGDSENDIDCPECNGDGRIDCNNCDGNGNVRCHECGGDGEISCLECGGDGTDSEGETCDECNGKEMTTCEECGGDGEVECNYCDGSGYEECSECDGGGSITYYNRIPYTINMCVSYDKKLKEIIQQKILRNEPIELSNKFESKTLILYMEETLVDDDVTETVNDDFENKEFFSEVLEKEEVLLRYRGNKLYCDGFDDQPERFFL